MSELSEARARIAETGVIDLHVDSFIWTRVCGYDVTKSHRTRRPPYFGGHSDLPRLRAAGVTGAFWSITTQPFRSKSARDARWRKNASHLLDSLGPEAGVRWVTQTAEYAAAQRDGQIALMLAIQGGNCLEGTPLDAPLPRELLRVTLTHLTASGLGAASTPFGGRGGLTPLGHAWVRRLDAARVLVDLAHANEQTFWDVLRIEGDVPPRIASHTGVSGIRPLWRNLSDAQLRGIAESGGCVGVIFHSPFLRPGFRRAGIADVVDHIAHIVSVAGEDTPAIGSDWDGAIRPAHGLEAPSGLAQLVAVMSRRGLSNTVIEKALAGNALRVLRALRGAA